MVTRDKRNSVIHSYALLVTIHYSLVTVHYSLVTIHYSLVTIHYLLFTIYYSLFFPEKFAEQKIRI